MRYNVSHLVLSMIVLSLCGCAAPGPNRFAIAFDSQPQGARVEMGKEFLGLTPCVGKVPGNNNRTFADKSGLAVGAGGMTWKFSATLGTNVQTKVFRAAGFVWSGEKIPEQIFFDFR